MPILIYKDFWCQELIRQTQPYYETWPVRSSSIIWPGDLWLTAGGRSHRRAVAALAVVIVLPDSLRGKRSVPLPKQPGVACSRVSCNVPGENHCHTVYRVSEHPTYLDKVYLFYGFLKHRSSILITKWIIATGIWNLVTFNIICHINSLNRLL